jgi:hypothetical protein
MKPLSIVAAAFALSACHVTYPGQETPQACTARFAGINNDGSRGWIPTYTFDLSGAKQTDSARLDKLAAPGTSVAVTVTRSGQSLKRIEGESVANGAQAVARGCAMQGHGVKFVKLTLSIPDASKRSN